MTAYEIIRKKRDGGKLTQNEIRCFVEGLTDGSIPDYQVSAFAMAVYFCGMDDDETAALTDAMAHSGEMLDLSRFGDKSVDKHSTGGVGDKTSLIVLPLAASCGAIIPKMSGRGLGMTGGTVDKLESIPGYKTSLDPQEFLSLAEQHGMALIGQTGNLAPADKKLYALRDVTATVDSIPLIVSSIMSKKLATGSHSIVLDVKFGSGAFMKTLEDARLLAEKMVTIGKKCGRNMAALITDMDTPLGHAVGNSLEVNEAVSVLKNQGPDDLTSLCVQLASVMVSLSLSLDAGESTRLVSQALVSGKALAKFREWIASQGGDTAFIDRPEALGISAVRHKVCAVRDGYISHIKTDSIGMTSVLLGAGRKKKTDSIDPTAGITFLKSIGDKVAEGQPIAILHTSSDAVIRQAEDLLCSSVLISPQPPEKAPVIREIIR